MFENLLGYIFTQFGMAGLIMLILVFSFFQFSESWVKLITKFFLLFKKDNIVYRGKDILLSKLLYWLEFKLDTISIHFNDPCRTKIFKDLLRFWFQSTKDNIFNLTEINNIEHLKSAELYREILNILTKIHVEFEDKCRKEGIPDIVITKFDGWINKNLEFCLKHIELICNSDIYDTNAKKIESVYYICISVLEITITEAEKTLKDINGELNGVQYKGCTCFH